MFLSCFFAAGHRFCSSQCQVLKGHESPYQLWLVLTTGLKNATKVGVESCRVVREEGRQTTQQCFLIQTVLFRSHWVKSVKSSDKCMRQLTITCDKINTYTWFISFDCFNWNQKLTYERAIACLITFETVIFQC